jgi:hypothetical protein
VRLFLCVIYRTLFNHLYSAGGLLQYCRSSESTIRVVQNRIRHLARNCLYLMEAALERHPCGEDLAMDGFESFTRSQYHPNNINLVAGGESQFFFAATHSLLRRKGRMSEYQKANRAVLERLWKPAPDAIERECRALLADLAPLIEKAGTKERPLTLWSDKHRAYPRALKAVAALAKAIAGGRLLHKRVSSLLKRDCLNPLFSVNYIDRQIRKNMGEHVRETVKQGREVNCQMERMAIFIAGHNFLTPHRVTHRHIWGHCRRKLKWIEKIWQHLYENPPAVKFKEGVVSDTVVALGPRMMCAQFLA